MISAIVLAAGQSRRMGRPKLSLPWGGATLLGQVLSTLAQAGVEDILVVTGAARQAVEPLVAGLSERFPVHCVQNSDYAQSEMLGSIQAGLRALTDETQAALIVLGDQPQMQANVVRRVLDAYRGQPAGLVIPSYHRRRGHPWLVDRRLWPDLLALSNEQTPRDFLNAHAAGILYLPVGDDSILRDVDTPEAYAAERPAAPQE